MSAPATHPRGPQPLHPVRAVLVVALGLLVQGCEQRGGSSVDLPAGALPSEASLAALPLGDVAGRAAATPAALVADPLTGNAGAIAEGHRLFIVMNCAGCHGYDARGNMGPDLTDTYWRYGGTASAIYKSIYEGRPKGMPAWGRAVPAEDIWKIVAWLETLGGTVPEDRYQAGIQGDHDVTSIAAEVHDPALEAASGPASGADPTPGESLTPAALETPRAPSTPSADAAPGAPVASP